jgi:hypothetical protein
MANASAEDSAEFAAAYAVFAWLNAACAVTIIDAALAICKSHAEPFQIHVLEPTVYVWFTDGDAGKVMTAIYYAPLNIQPLK